MKVLHVYKTFFPETQGGLEEAIRQICRCTAAHGVDARVLTLGPRGARLHEGGNSGNVVRYRRDIEIASCGMSVSALAHFGKETEWADIVHYHFPWPFADLMHLYWRVSTPSIVTYHSDIVRQRRLFSIYRPLMRRFLRSQSAIVGTSPNYVRSSPVLDCHRDQVEVIPLGLDPDTYPEPDLAIEQRLRARFGEGFVLFVGVFRYYKGLSCLLEAARTTGAMIVLAGDGPLNELVRHEIAAAGCSNVRLAGRVTDVEKVALYRLCRAVVLPSCERSEAYGMTLVEAAMYGKPMISTELGTGTSYINQNGETGFVTSPDSPHELGKVIDRLFKDNELAERMGRAARIRFDNVLDGRIMGDKYVRLYRKVMPPRNTQCDS